MNHSKATRSHIRFLNEWCLFCFLMLFTSFYSQDTLAPTHFEPSRIKARLARNPVTLAQELTAGKTSEKEKFDAIFTWVIWNIHYNYRLYNSGRANSSNPSIKRILERKTGICTDFAFTMDTLCELAGIPNETVTGYAKEIIFDLNDTLYFDNHAWNAVRLNGLWFLYDATWCARQKTVEYTRFSLLILKWLDQLESKRKLVTKTLQIRSKKDPFCGLPGTTNLKSVNARVLPFIPKILRNMLMHFRLRTREKERFVANTTYYLANPETFAMTHFPNNPDWSLTQKIHNVFEFSADSAFYNRNYTLDQRPPREGRFCLNCDNYYYSDKVSKEKLTLEGSLRNNPNNHLIPANYNLFMAGVLFDQMLETEDSLTKMELIDSTITYLDTCKSELRNSRVASRAEFRAQVSKNRDKKNELITDNKRHRALSKKILDETNKRRVKTSSLQNKSKYYTKRGKKAYSKFNQAFDQLIRAKKYNAELVAKFNQELKQSVVKSDSLTARIRILQNRFVADASDLWGNLVEKQQVLVPLGNLFYKDAFLRHFYYMDNYERVIRDIRTRIDYFEDSLFTEIHGKVISLSDSIYAEFTLMSNLVKERNAINLKSLKTMRSLNSCGQLASDSLDHFREITNEVMKEDICWNKDNEFLIRSVCKNFKIFLSQSRSFSKAVYRNNDQEIRRFEHFNTHIQRNRNRVLNAVDGNSKSATAIRKASYDHRRSYLNKLRKMQR